jgi:FAD:protein FMN transferase
MRAHGFRAMGTDVRVLAPAASAEACAVVESLFADWEAVLSRFRPESDLSRVNAGAGQPVQVDRLLVDVTVAALAAARATRGLFDPTLEQELARIGYDRSFEHVAASGPPAGMPRPGGAWKAVEIDRTRSTVTVPPGCGLDLGGIAKGMAVDAALDRLASEGVDRALVSAGGDLAVRGHLPGAVPWTIQVGDAADGFEVQLLRGALATSGTTKRRWCQGALHRHHVVDPRTGEPSRSGLRQVTVAAATCRAAEAAATAVLVAGPVLGRHLIEAWGLAGLLVDDFNRTVAAGRWPQPDVTRAA